MSVPARVIDSKFSLINTYCTSLTRVLKRFARRFNKDHGGDIDLRRFSNDGCYNPDLLSEMNWKIDEGSDTIEFTGEHAFWDFDKDIMEAIAPYVEPGSYIVIQYPDDLFERWYFELDKDDAGSRPGSCMVTESGKIVWTRE